MKSRPFSNQRYALKRRALKRTMKSKTEKGTFMSKDFPIFAIFVAALGCCGISIQAATQTLNVGGDLSDTADGMVAHGSEEVLRVKARGVGANKVEALKDAYRDAVESAVGLYVDAEQQIKNDRLLSDEVLTQSNAFIQKYDIIKEEVVDSLVQVRILAEVRKTPLVKKLSDLMPASKVALGNSLKNVHASIVTTETRNVDGAALLKNVLGDFDPCKQLLTATLVSNKPKIVENTDDSERVRLMYPFQISVDRERYLKGFMPRLKQVLDQISITPPKKVRILGAVEDRCQSARADGQKYIQDGPDKCVGSFYGYEVFGSTGFFDGLDVFRLALSRSDICWGRTLGGHPCKIETCGVWRQHEYELKGKPLTVILVTGIKGKGMSMKGEAYTVDGVSAKIIDEWQNKIGGMNVSGPRYEIVFKGTDDEEVAYGRWQPNAEGTNKGGNLLSNCVCLDRSFGSGGKPEVYWIVTPLLRAAAERYVEWVPFNLQKDDLLKISSVSIELVD